MAALQLNLAPMTPAQLRRLQTLWHQWVRPLGLSRERDQRLRHAYVELLTCGRARQTRELTAADAAYVIRRLRRATLRRAPAAYRFVLGTAGRRDYEDHPEVKVTPAALGLLERTTAALGLSPRALDRFIARHYAARGLRARADLRTMADLNRVLWGLKAMLRRRAA